MSRASISQLAKKKKKIKEIIVTYSQTMIIIGIEKDHQNRNRKEKLGI
jgi:hypothetical protein